MGGPLIVIPVSALDAWRGCTESGMIVGDGVDPDDYDRACAVDDLGRRDRRRRGRGAGAGPGGRARRDLLRA
ncbi:Imm21 family immunity protein [Streptomyces sp. L2]|uniref:Imm21 family immunity protein n=1 Tax=Streptomyces sp. L2 TaxID=2162665 RepID=UPI00240D8CB1|nr:Imm21 family immunity protein [Streptomyces sp. L2]